MVNEIKLLGEASNFIFKTYKKSKTNPWYVEIIGRWQLMKLKGI